MKKEIATMPIYEFICRNCDQQFEKLVPTSRRDSIECPDCGSPRTGRRISLTAPAQIKSGGASKAASMSETCGMPNCCGGSCGSF